MKLLIASALLLAWPLAVNAAGSADGEVCAGFRALEDEDARAAIRTEVEAWAALTAETRELQNDGRPDDDATLVGKAQAAGTAMGRVYLLCSCNARLKESELCASLLTEIESLIYP